MKLSSSPSHNPSIRNSETASLISVKILGTAALVLALLGCAGKGKTMKSPSLDAEKTVSVKPTQKKRLVEAPPVPLTATEQLTEKQCHRLLKGYSQGIVKQRNAVEIHQMEKELKYADKKDLQEKQEQCILTMKYLAFKAFRSILETNPRCWPRLLMSLKDMTQNKPVIKDLSEYGALEKRADSHLVIEFQKVMYKEVVEILAALVAECDKDLRTLRNLANQRLPVEIREKLDKQIRGVEQMRKKFIGSLENGTLLPNNPVPEEGRSETLLEIFHQMRDKQGGLPKGNTTGPERVKFANPSIQVPTKEEPVSPKAPKKKKSVRYPGDVRVS